MLIADFLQILAATAYVICFQYLRVFNRQSNLIASVTNLIVGCIGREVFWFYFLF